MKQESLSEKKAIGRPEYILLIAYLKSHKGGGFEELYDRDIRRYVDLHTALRYARCLEEEGLGKLRGTAYRNSERGQELARSIVENHSVS